MSGREPVASTLAKSTTAGRGVIFRIWVPEGAREQYKKIFLAAGALEIDRTTGLNTGTFMPENYKSSVSIADGFVCAELCTHEGSIFCVAPLRVTRWESDRWVYGLVELVDRDVREYDGEPDHLFAVKVPFNR